MSHDDRYESHDRYDDHGDDHGRGSDDHYEHVCGSSSDDWLRGSYRDDHIEGGSGNDDLNGGRGSDRVIGGDGDDLMHGGRGADDLIGGNGADNLWGDLGANIIRAGANDGVVNQIVVTADSVFNPAGNPGGVLRDLLFEVEASDRIVFNGVEDSRLSFVGNVTDPRGSGVVGVGIYVDGTLEALVQSGLSAAQVDGITTGLV